MTILEILLSVALLTALFFVWYFWRQRNAYREGYYSYQRLVGEMSQPEPFYLSVLKGLAAGILAGLAVKAYFKLRGESQETE